MVPTCLKLAGVLAVGGVHARQQDNDASLEAAGKNPIRKVVTLLQNLQKKVEAEGEKEAELFKKYMCYCKTGAGTLQESISGNTAKVPQLQSSIVEAEAQKKQFTSDLAQHQTDRAAAKAASAKATAIREKEATAFSVVKAEYTTNISALAKAVAAIDKGMSGSFLQTDTAQQLRRLIAEKADVSDVDRQDVMAFLSAGQGGEYSPASGSISGILKEIKDTMGKELEEATSDEAAAVESYGGLMAANTKIIAAATAAIETKSVRVGELGVSVAMMKGDLTDSEEALIEDQKFLADMSKNCDSKAAEWDEIQKVRSEEMVALADTIKMLNDDDALELFKKAIPASAASFVEMEDRKDSTRTRALAAISAPRGKKDVRVDFIALALHGKKIGFEKVIKMIDNMVATLKVEQQDDEHKKEYCTTQFDIADDKKKGLEQSISDSEAAIDSAKEDMATLTDEIKALKAGLKALDKSVEEATEQRQDEHKDHTELMAQDTAAKELIGLAKNRLQKFYNPKLYEPPAEPAMFVQISSHRQHKDAPAAPPQAPGAYKKKGEESSGVIHLLDVLVQDLDKEMTVAETEEKDAQADYESTMAESQSKRAEDSKAVTNKMAAKAEAEGTLQMEKDSKASASKELMGTVEYISSLHGECDWLLKYFDTRKEARASEIDALGKAKAVLGGADFSLMQTQARLRGAARQAPEDKLAAEMTHDLEMNFNKIAPFGKEDTAKELQDHAAKTQDTLVDAVENAEVAEIKRAVFRALTRLRAATIKEFDTIARLETQAIDAYNDAHHYRAENPLAHLHEDEAPVETDKLKSFH